MCVCYSSWTNQVVHSKDHAAVQVNIFTSHRLIGEDDRQAVGGVRGWGKGRIRGANGRVTFITI